MKKLFWTAVILITTISGIFGQIPTEGLRFYYPLDGDITDHSGNNEDGNVSFLSFTEDRFGNPGMAYFNDSDNLSGIVNPVLYNDPQSFTVAYWIKTDDRGPKIEPDEGVIISILSDQPTGTSFRHDRKFSLGLTGILSANVYPGYGVWLKTSPGYADNAWHHLAMCLSPTSGFQFYVDGVMVESDPGATSAQHKNGYWRFGGFLVNARNAYYGSFDDIRVYDRALNSSEVESLYAESDPFSLNLIETHVSSIGGSDGSIDLEIDGGMPPYSYNWSNGTSTRDISGLTSGLYSVMVTDALGQNASSSIRIYDLLHDIRDGKSYKALQVGEQIWMAENMNLGTRVNGGSFQSNNGVIEKYCYDNQEINCDTYGGLYQWDEMMQFSAEEGDQGVCPDSWHVPSKSEVETLVNQLGGYDIAGGVLKDTSSVFWNPPNVGASNESGMSFWGTGGWHPVLNSFFNLGIGSSIVSSRELNSSEAEVLHMRYDGENSYWDNNSGKTMAYAVRCIKNECSWNSIILEETDVSCGGGNDGSIELLHSGGVLPYSYEWSNGETTSVITNLIPGMYSVTVTDANGCEISGEAEIMDGPWLLADAGEDFEKCELLEAELQGNQLANTTGTWTMVSGPGTVLFEDINASNSMATVDAFGTYVLRWTISDGICSESDELSILFRNEIPEITRCPENFEAQTVPGECDVPISWDAPLASHSCDAENITWWSSHQSGDRFHPGLSTVVYEAYDSSGDTAVCSFDVLISDGVTPVIESCIPDKELVLDAGCEVSLPDYTSAPELVISECSNYTVTQLPLAGTVITDTSIVNILLIDEYGNLSACSFNVNVYLNPDQTEVNAGPDQVICNGLAAQLSGEAPDPGSGEWSQVAGAGSVTFTDVSNPNSTATVDHYGTYIFRWTVSNVECLWMDEVEINFGGNTNVANAGPDRQICLGQQVVLTAEGGESYLWDNNVENGAGFYPTETDDYHVIIYDEQGCDVADTVTVQVNPLPVANGGPDQDVCAGEEVTLYATGGVSYQWSNGIPNEGAFVAYNALDLNVIVTNEFGCSDTDEVYIQVREQPDSPSIRIVSDTLISDSDFLHQWYLDGNSIPGAVASTYKPLESGNYYTVVTNAGCESEKSNTIFIQLTDIKKEMSKDIVAYPNPSHGKLTVFSDRDADSYRIIRISGEDGKIVYQRILERNENRMDISLEGAPGIYLIQIIYTDGKENAMKKILLVK